MKKLTLTLAIAAIAVSGYSQGTFQFLNRNTGNGVDAPIYYQTVGGDPLAADTAGGNWVAQMLVGPSADSLAPVSVAAPLRTGSGAGYWNPATEDRLLKVDSVAPGAEASIQIIAWDSNQGTFADAQAAGVAFWGQSSVFTQTAGEAPVVVPGGAELIESPAYLTNMSGFAVAVPEPSTIALALLGGVAVFFGRRKK